MKEDAFDDAGSLLRLCGDLSISCKRERERSECDDETRRRKKTRCSMMPVLEKDRRTIKRDRFYEKKRARCNSQKKE